MSDTSRLVSDTRRLARDRSGAGPATARRVAGLGLLLLLVGVAIVMPAGRTPGAAAHRIVRLNSMSTDTTPGHRQGEAGWKRALIRVAIGLAVIGLGFVCLAIGIPADR